MRYAVVTENANGNFSAYVPDLPGCVATGDTLADTEANIREAIRFHIDGLKEHRLPVPEPSAVADYVEARSRSNPSPFRGGMEPVVASDLKRDVLAARAY